MPLPRKLAAVEIDEVLSAVVPLHLGTVDSRGYPHVTPLWYCYEEGAFWMTSLPSKPHVRRLRANRRASVCIDLEDVERSDGQRPNRQVRAVGDAALSEDLGAMWTKRITERYILGEGRSRSVAERIAHPRVVIRLDADVVAVSSV